MSLFNSIKHVFGGNGKYSNTEIRARADEQAIHDIKALRAGEEEWTPEILTREEKIIALKRHWHHVHPDFCPENEESLFLLEPSTLNEEEIVYWYHGLRAEACQRYQAILNSVYSKTELKAKLEEEGLTDALTLMDKPRDECFLTVIKQLSD